MTAPSSLVKQPPPPLVQGAPVRQRGASLPDAAPQFSVATTVDDTPPDALDTQFAGLVSEVQALNHRLGIYRELPEDIVAQAYYWGESLFVDTKV